MASSFLSFAPLTVNLNSHRHPTIFSPDFRGRINRIRCNGETPTTNSSSKRGSEPENALLKLAWYGSELLGIAASFFRSPASIVAPQLDLKPATEELEALDRATVVNTIKEDFQRSYFVTGNLTLHVYEEDCEFADPAGSFKGLSRFKRNCANFGLLIERSNMKLMKWENFEDKGIGHWRFSCVMSFPWRPILSGTSHASYQTYMLR
uniref:Uncharacterized protein MANES_05G030400 n=1 Tax=Rhizophora mucronata TaxID=61149 RepID=A0A2P2JZM6_RHIMU